MAGYNRVILIGNLTNDPELRYTPQGTAVADLRLAVSEVRGSRGGERKEETLFIDVTVWERQAETCSEYLAKGRTVLVEGRLALDEWQDKESGEKRRKIRVIANLVRFLGPPRGEGEGGANRRKSSPPPQAAEEQAPADDTAAKDKDDMPF